MIESIHVLIIAGVAWVVFRKYGRHHPRIFWSSFIYKISMGAALGLVYLYYYTANDTWLFFQDANALAQFGKNDFSGYLRFLVTDEAPRYLSNQIVNSQERSLFLIKMMSVFLWIGGSNYWVSAAYFSLISFFAAWYFFTVITTVFQNSVLAASLSFLFFPSIVFWSSGLVKETLALAAIYFISGLFLKYYFARKSRWFEWILALCSFWIAWNLKYYWTALFGAVLITYMLVFFLSKRFSVFQRHKMISWLVIFIFLGGGVSLLHPNFYLNRFLEVLITNHNDFTKISEDHGLIHYYNFHTSWWSVIFNSPWALFSGLLRPFIWEASGTMAVLASLENLIISVLLVSSLRRIRKINSHRLLLLSVIVFIVLLCVFLALSTPNLGTLSRYRVGFLPFLIFIISYRNPLVDYLNNRIRILQP